MQLKNGTSPLPRLHKREETADPQREAEAIKQCLEYLSREAMKLDMRLIAHLIGVAAESLEIRNSKGRD